MTNQEIFETLAEIEEGAFYCWTNCNIEEAKDALRSAHLAAREALKKFAAATGCHN